MLLAVAIPSVRHGALRAAGSLLVLSDPVEPVDLGVMTESGEAGELEVSDLYHRGVFAKVMVLTPEPTPVDRELDRRGVHREDVTLSTLVQLGVPRSAIITVPAGEGGTTESTEALATWVRTQPSRVLVVVSTTHARRYRRALLRVWPGGAPPPRVTYPRASSFRADDWWAARRTRREGLVELEKLALDYLQHPW